MKSHWFRSEMLYFSLVKHYRYESNHPNFIESCNSVVVCKPARQCILEYAIIPHHTACLRLGQLLKFVRALVLTLTRMRWYLYACPKSFWATMSSLPTMKGTLLRKLSASQQLVYFLTSLKCLLLYNVSPLICVVDCLVDSFDSKRSPSVWSARANQTRRAHRRENSYIIRSYFFLPSSLLLHTFASLFYCSAHSAWLLKLCTRSVRITPHIQYLWLSAQISPLLPLPLPTFFPWHSQSSVLSCMMPSLPHASILSSAIISAPMETDSAARLRHIKASITFILLLILPRFNFCSESFPQKGMFPSKDMKCALNAAPSWVSSIVYDIFVKNRLIIQHKLHKSPGGRCVWSGAAGS